MSKLSRFLRRARPAGRVGRITDGIVRRADAARDAGHHVAAAMLYEEALRLLPGRAGVHIQAGHMFKEAGELSRAGHHYAAALALTPRDADLVMQIGHYHKIADRPDEALAHYGQAAALRPGWRDPAEQAALLRRMLEGEAAPAEAAAGVIAPELLPGVDEQVAAPAAGELRLHRLGAVRMRSPWGMLKALRGVEAIRGYLVAPAETIELELLVAGIAVQRATLVRGPHDKHVFNLWHDFTPAPRGRQMVELRFMSGGAEVRSHAEPLLIADPRGADEAARSDATFLPEPGDRRPLADQIAALPSLVHAPARGLADGPIETVLVQRADQLGDLAVSVPALQRIRAMLPGARIVGLLTPANADLAEALGLFDEVLVLDAFVEDAGRRRRVMTAAAQKALQARLAPFRFDLAIDLGEGAASRALLLMAGARLTFGFDLADMPWLSASAQGATRDPANGHAMVPHGAKVLALTAWLEAILGHDPQPVRRPALAAEVAGPYVLLHTGARLAFSRWPCFDDLARLLLARTALSVAILAEEDEAIPADLAEDARVRIVRGRLPFDRFDALVHHCAVFVGNDSGPKHLAALRGVPVVSVHMARTNWSEWGQQSGLVVSRRIPCAGCGIHYDPEECGRDFACLTGISAEEVYAAIDRLIGAGKQGGERT